MRGGGQIIDDSCNWIYQKIDSGVVLAQPYQESLGRSNPENCRDRVGKNRCYRLSFGPRKYFIQFKYFSSAYVRSSLKHLVRPVEVVTLQLFCIGSND